MRTEFPSRLTLTVVKLRLLRWCLAQNVHYGYLAVAIALILAAMLIGGTAAVHR